MDSTKKIGAILPSDFKDNPLHAKNALLYFDVLGILDERKSSSKTIRMLEEANLLIQVTKAKYKIHAVARSRFDNDARKYFRDTINFPTDIRRLEAILINGYTNYRPFAIPVYDSQESVALTYNHTGDNATQIQIMLYNMPAIGGDIPWEELIQFRLDPENERKRFALLNWQNEIERQNLKPYEIADLIAHLAAEYSHYMEIQKMKTTSGKLSQVLILSAEVIESMAKLKLSKAVKAMLSFNKLDLQLMEAEINAPGREVAYIVEANAKFKK